MNIDVINEYLGKMKYPKVRAEQLTLLEVSGTDEVYRVHARHKTLLLVRHREELAWLWQHCLPLTDIICFDNGTGKYIWR